MGTWKEAATWGRPGVGHGSLAWHGSGNGKVSVDESSGGWQLEATQDRPLGRVDPEPLRKP